MSTVTITITSENDDFSDSLDEVKRHLTDGYKSGRDENDTESYIFQRSYL